MPKDANFDAPGLTMYGETLAPAVPGDAIAPTSHTRRFIGELEVREHADLTYTAHLVHAGTRVVRVDGAHRPTVAAAQASAHQQLVTSGIPVPGGVPNPR